MTGVILSGGKNRRMGTNKAFLEYEGERLIDRTVRLFRAVFQEIIIVTSSPLEYLDLDAVIVTDIFPGKGALGGLYTGLFYATGDHAFVTACDMPFLNRLFLEYMVSQSEGLEIVVPVSTDGLQPLHAIYARTCLPAIRNLLDRNGLKIKEFYPGHRILEIREDTIRSFHPGDRMFMNLNTPDDMKALISSPTSASGTVRPKD